jgi:decaprenylphospho-beta-D-ribofuranose 2-oxidase
VIAPRREDEVRAVLVDRVSDPAAGGLIARGAGRSYGDAAQNARGTVLDMTSLDRIVAVDDDALLVTAQVGATLAKLLAHLAQRSLTLPVLPGTSQITLGGAIASDVHGKNHHWDGAFARHVASLSLLTPDGRVSVVSPDCDGDLFYATLGGMGLTGIILEATVRVEPLATPWVTVDTDRTTGLDQTLALFAGAERTRYSVAWLDLLAPGAKMGRGVIARADPLTSHADAPAPSRLPGTRARYTDALLAGPRLEIPPRWPGGLLKPSAVRAFNALHWRFAPRRERARPTAMVPYFFPLDAVGAWNRLYGREGLIQYQFVLPDGAESVLERCFALIRALRLPVYLAVFKRFGAAFGGPLSFPLRGWTLAIDLPARAPGLAQALDALDELIAAAGGRVYLSKDARLRADLLAAMYPQLDRFRAVRERVDPDGLLRSDLSRRLDLDGSRA